MCLARQQTTAISVKYRQIAIYQSHRPQRPVDGIETDTYVYIHRRIGWDMFQNANNESDKTNGMLDHEELVSQIPNRCKTRKYNPH